MWRDSGSYLRPKLKTAPTGLHSIASLEEGLDALSRIAPAGFSIGLHIRFASPLVYVRTYDPSWAEHYDNNSYVLRDPSVFWGLGGVGSTRWSAIKLPDPFNVFGQARRYGLTYGATISVGLIGSRSIMGMAHESREFTDAEIADAEWIVNRLHAIAEPSLELTPAQVEALRLLAEGERHAAAAAKLGISESAFKARLQSARGRLDARTTAQALKKAREYQLL